MVYFYIYYKLFYIYLGCGVNCYNFGRFWVLFVDWVIVILLGEKFDF